MKNCERNYLFELRKNQTEEIEKKYKTKLLQHLSDEFYIVYEKNKNKKPRRRERNSKKIERKYVS